MRIGIWPVMSRNFASWAWLVAYFRKSHAVPLWLQAVYIPMFFASLKVWMSPTGVPFGVGTGTAAQSTSL